MACEKTLKGVAHNIAHHAASGLSYINPHLAKALRQAHIDTTAIDLLTPSPYPPGVRNLKPLRFSLGALRSKSLEILERNGFSSADVRSIVLHAHPDPYDHSGYILFTRTVIESVRGRVFDSGWISYDGRPAEVL
jgi:hypothetical protein